MNTLQVVKERPNNKPSTQDPISNRDSESITKHVKQTP